MYLVEYLPEAVGVSDSVPPVEDEGSDQPTNESLHERGVQRTIIRWIRDGEPAKAWFQTLLPNKVNAIWQRLIASARPYQPGDFGSILPG